MSSGQEYILENLSTGSSTLPVDEYCDKGTLFCCRGVGRTEVGVRFECRPESGNEAVCVESRADFMVGLDQGSEESCVLGVEKTTCISGFTLSTSEYVTMR